MSYVSASGPDVEAPYGYCRGAKCGRPLTVARTMYPGWHDGCAADSGLALPLTAPGEVPRRKKTRTRQAEVNASLPLTEPIGGLDLAEPEVPPTCRACGWPNVTGHVCGRGLGVLPHRSRTAQPKALTTDERRLLRQQRLLADLGDVCYFCADTLTVDTITREHLTPTSRGGTSDELNVVAACYRCNNAKGNMTETEFVEWLRKVVAVMEGGAS